MRRFLGLLGVAALMAASALPVAAANPSQLTSYGHPTIGSRLTGAKTESGRLAQSDPALLARNDSAMVNIMVKLDLDSVASYKGGIAGLAPTSPSVTGQSVEQNSGATAAYKQYAAGRVTLAQHGAQKLVSSIQIGRQFTVAYGGFSARVPANQAKNLLKVPGVVAVQYDAVNHPTALDSPNFIGATQVWPGLGGSAKAGAGVKFADLDTGIWPENPMLADNGNLPAPAGGPFQCNFGTSGQPHDANFTCNNKLIGAYAFVDTNLAVNGAPPPGYFCKSDGSSCSARDGEGHGTHTATTAAGDLVNHAVLLGVDRGPVSGIAPGAEVLMYRVCIQDSCYESDSVDAVQQAIQDDVDVINFSIGGGGDPYTDPVELAFLDAYASGIAVNASAGNSGPGAGTAEHAGPWETTVGASTLDRSFDSTLHLTADGGASLDLTGVTITAGITSPTPVILASAAPYSDAICNSAPSSGSEFAGKVVVCERGNNGRIDKGHNVYLGGGAGMILYNQAANVTDLESDNHFLPAIQVQYAGNAVHDFVANHTNVRATWAAGSAQPAQGDVMASFSSRGPEPDFIKPDVTAPGVQILAGNTPYPASVDGGRPGENFQAIAGTSMSSPHASGTSLLLKAAHPSWTPGQIKSAMMTSSVQSVVKEDGVTPADPFDRGAGSIRANRAINPTVTFEASAPDFYASANDPFARINLNLASIDAPNMPGKITTSRTAHNVTNTTQTLKITAKAPNNSTITISPSTITLAPFGNATFQVTINGSNLADGWHFGQITLTPTKSGYNTAVLPVAFDKGPGQVNLSNSCDSNTSTVNAGSITMSKGDTANCEVTVTNYANEQADVSLRVKAPNTDRLIVRNYSDGDKKGNGFLWNGSLSPALAPEITGLTSPENLYGYIPLDTFGPLDLGEGDESLVNVNTDSFSYGGEIYSSIAVDSNGYLIVGGSDNAADNVCCDTMAMPDPSRPNNVLAPYWTDLNPSTHGKVQVAELTDGTYNYLVAEWQQVPVYGTSNYRSAEVWIVLGDRSTEDQTFAYDSDYMGPGAPTGLLVGAENRDGTSAAALPLNTVPDTDGYTVSTGTPTAGGSKTISYDLYAKRTGNFDVKALMTSDVTQGTAVQIVKVHVVNP
jgi:hypothetical protein